MKLFDRFWIVFALLFCVTASPQTAFASTPAVIFSEIAWAGSSISSSDEWIELANTTGDSVDVSGWTITGAGSAGATLTLPANSAIAPYSTYVISNYEYTHTNSALATKSQYVTATLSLPNSGFSLYLYDAIGAQIDVGGRDGNPIAGRSGSTAQSLDGRYASMVRVDGLIAGSETAAWADAQTSAGFKEGIADFGTPGALEVATSAPVNEDAQTTQTNEPDAQASNDETAQVTEVETMESTENAPTTISNAGTAVINEFVVDPLEGEKEWIEIRNVSQTEINLAGWSVEDATQTATILEQTALAPGRYYLIQSSKGKLNNDKDIIILRDPAGAIIDEISYGNETLKAPKDGASLARDSSGAFQITNSTTPGEDNLITVPTTKTEAPTQTTDESSNVSATNDPTTEETTDTESKVAPQETTTSPPAQTEPSPASAILQTLTSTTLRFISLYPNTTGSDEDEEYIEINNYGDSSVDLKSWAIKDASGKKSILNDSIIIIAGSSVRLSRGESKITLNNGSETLELIAPDGQMIDFVAYEKAPNGEIYSRNGGGWEWSGTDAQTTASATSEEPPSAQPVTQTQSPATQNSNSTNQIPATQSLTAAKNTTTQTRYASTDQYRQLTISEAKNLTDGTKVQITGVVSVVPGTLARQIFYLEDETGGIQTYLYDGMFPTLTIGQNVRVRAVMTTSHGERRIKADDKGGIVALNTNSEIVAATRNIDELTQNDIGRLMIINGNVQSLSDTKLTLEQDGETLDVYLKSNPLIDVNQFERGDKLEIIGVLTTYDSSLRLRPRSGDDIKITQRAADVLAASSAAGGKTRSQYLQTQLGVLLLIACSTALGIFALAHARKRRVALAAS